VTREVAPRTLAIALPLLGLGAYLNHYLAWIPMALLVWLALRDIRWFLALGLVGLHLLTAAQVPLPGLVLVNLLALVHIAQRRQDHPGSRGWLLIGWLGVLLVYLLVRSGTAIGMDKWLKLASRTVLVFPLAVIARKERDSEGILSCLLIASACVVFVALGVWARGDSDLFMRLRPGGLNPILLGRAAGLAVLAGIVVWRDALGSRIWFIVFFAAAVTVMFLTGSRGPILGLVAMLPIILTTISTIRERAAMVAGVGAALVAGFLVIVTMDPASRLALGHVAHATTQLRAVLWSEALADWLEAPWFGHGFGSFARLFSWSDLSVYPHNLFLELLAETGAVGAMLVLVAFVLPFTWWRRMSRGTRGLLALWVFTLLQAQFSGDLAANAEVFLLLPLVSPVDSR